MRPTIVGYGSLVLLSCAALGQNWQPAGTLPTGGAPRVYAAGVDANGVLYAVGGAPWQNGGDQDGAVHRYQGGSWTQVASLDGMGPIVSGAAGVDNLGRIVVYGGFILGDDGPGGEKAYDPAEGPQTSIAPRDVPSQAIGYFAWARDHLGRLYGFGGGPGAGGPNSGYSDRYDGALDTWTALTPMPTPAADACAAYDGVGHVLVFGGINAAGDARLANVAQYDIASNTWSDTAIPDMPSALSGARAVLGADGRVYVVGGESGPLAAGVTQATVYKLELAANAWTPVATMATPRKWFACVLGHDDCIYAVGGDNDDGGTNTVEKLFTPRCPSIASGPEAQAPFKDTIAGFSVTVSGATPMAFQWRKDGVELSDGPTGGGSTISGALTSALVIMHPGEADAGAYDVVVTNDCGAVTSAAADLTLRWPPPPPSQWQVAVIHPAWASGASVATGVSGGTIVGQATMPTLLPDGRTLDLSHPVAWDAATMTPVDLTPAGSAGGAVLGVSADLLVGWFWHLYSCPPWTCGWESAGYWSGNPPLFDEVHVSGAEYDHVNATDGVRMVGTATFEYSEGNYTSKAYLWTPPNGQLSLHPAAGVSGSGANAIDGAHQYGSITTPNPGATVHAAMWSGVAASVMDVHPGGYSRSWILGAGDGQAVGAAYLGDSSHAGLWVGAAAFLDLNPPAAIGSSLVAAHGGVQVGNGPGGAGIWFGTPASFMTLTDHLPPNITSATARDVDVSDGVITVVGSGFNSATGRSEALVWRSAPACPGDLNGDAVVNQSDLGILLSAFGQTDEGDLDGDGDTDQSDLGILLGNFGSNC